jgi:hypothetical protein
MKPKFLSSGISRRRLVSQIACELATTKLKFLCRSGESTSSSWLTSKTHLHITSCGSSDLWPKPFFSSRPARDSVRVSVNEALLHHEAARGPTELVTSISFGTHKPLLRKLSFVLELISNFVSEYQLFNHQCYWFSVTIMRAGELEFERAEVKPHPGFERAGTFLGIPIPRGSAGQSKCKPHPKIRSIHVGLLYLHEGQ